jgi:hypothetical protein
MRTGRRSALVVVGVALGVGLLLQESGWTLPHELQVATQLLGPGLAEAQYGTSRRVARRTSRRTAGRHAAYGGYGYGYDVDVAVVAPPPAARYVSALPTGCVAVTMNGVGYQRCGSAYYRPYYQGDTLVYMEETP